MNYGSCINCIVEMKSDSNLCYALSHWASYFITEGNQLINHLPLTRPRCVFPIVFFKFIATASMRACCIMCPGTDLKLIPLLFPRSPFWEVGICLCFSSHWELDLFFVTFPRWNTETLLCFSPTFWAPSDPAHQVV